VPDIFDEVEEDLRAEQMRRLLQRYGVLLLAALVLVVVGVGAWKAWQYRQQQKAVAVAAKFVEATGIADQHPGPGRQAAIPLLVQVEHEGAAGYRSLARLRHAALLAEAGDAAGAASLWRGVADDNAADQGLRQVATLQWAQHELDRGDPQAVAARLAPLAQPDNPWHGLAQEAQALLALRQGDAVGARALLQPLSQDNAVTEDVRQRAAGLLAMMEQGKPQAAAHGS
jgi:hypothetical protein